MQNEFKTGQEVKIIGNTFGGLGKYFELNDIGTITDFQDDTASVYFDHMDRIIYFKLKDLQHINSKKISKETLEDKKAIELAKEINKIPQIQRQMIEKQRADEYNKNKHILDDLLKSEKAITNHNILINQKLNKERKPIGDNLRLIKYLLSTGYEKIKITGDKLFAITKPISIHYTPIETDSIFDTTYQLGSYSIIVDLIDDKIKVKEVNERSIGNNCHPHILNGTCCFGTYAPKILKLIANGLYFEFLNIMFDYLNNINPDDWYMPIMHWHPKSSEYCPECWDSDCSCISEDNICSHCDEDINDCICITCPNTGEQMEDNSFPDSFCDNCLYHKDIVNDDTGCFYNSTTPIHIS